MSFWSPLNPPLADWQGRGVWIVGASSGIGRATAALLARQGAVVAVSARNAVALEAFARSHPAAIALPLDVTDPVAVARAAAALDSRLPQLDLVLFCAGHYKPQRATRFDLPEMLRHQQINYVGALYVLDAVLPRMLAAGRGHLSLVGSVAGYRGLPQSLAYGPTKAALINLAETLYLDLSQQGLGVSIVNPGFVDTPLTAQNDFSMPALITPEQAAEAIVQGWARGSFEIDFPKRFTRGMKLLRLLGQRGYFSAVRRATGL